MPAMMQPASHLSAAIQNKPLIIPVFIPHAGCPHHCTFCNQKTISGQGSSSDIKSKIQDAIDVYLPYRADRKKVELAFFGGNFLGLGDGQIKSVLETAQLHVDKGDIHGIRFSTRPDTIDEQRLALIRSFPIRAIELGVQSMNDTVLENVQRGHTSEDTISAIRLLKKSGYTTGVQLMVGLPGETWEQMMEGTRRLAEFKPDMARIYPLLVLRGALLAQAYETGQYAPMKLEASVQAAKKMFQIFSAAGVKVIRMGLQASDLLDDPQIVLAGPWHPAFGHLVYSELMYDEAFKKMKMMVQPGESVQILVHPKSESRLRGDRNTNIARLQNAFSDIAITVNSDARITKGQIVIQRSDTLFK